MFPCVTGWKESKHGFREPAIIQLTTPHIENLERFVEEFEKKYAPNTDAPPATPTASGAVRDDEANATLDAHATGVLSPSEMADRFGVPLGALQKRLERWREKNPFHDGFIENEGRKPREAQYLYKPDAVKHIIDKLKTSSERPAKKN